MKYNYAEINDQFNHDHADFLTDYFLRSNTDGVPFYFAYISYKPGVRIFEESHQLAVCRNLLTKGAQVFVEPTQFIDPDIQTELEQTWGDRIQFVSLKELEQRRHLLYKIDW